MREKIPFGGSVSPSKLGVGAGLGFGLAALALAGWFYKRYCDADKKLPAPSDNKQNPRRLDKMHDRAVEDSMAASDPPPPSMPRTTHHARAVVLP